MIAPNTKIRVQDRWPEADGPVHIRTPHYLRGRPGTVLRHLGDFPNPEDLAFARPAPRRALYHVLFDGRAVWPDGSANDLVVELYEHWLDLA